MNNNTNQESQNVAQQNNETVLETIIPINPVESDAPDSSSNMQNIVPSQVENNTTNQQQTSLTQELQIQNELQNIPTVEQDTQSFINNVQTLNGEKKEEKKEGVNFIFIIILFIVILASIFFLFPLLLDYV